MTVELLLNLSRIDKNHEGFIASAVGTGNDSDHCGFLVSAIRDGELACLLDGGAEWLQSGFKFIPSRWYYVATTFRVKGADTEVNAFAADLSDQSPALSWIGTEPDCPRNAGLRSAGHWKGFRRSDGQRLSVAGATRPGVDLRDPSRPPDTGESSPSRVPPRRYPIRLEPSQLDLPAGNCKE